MATVQTVERHPWQHLRRCYEPSAGMAFCYMVQERLLDHAIRHGMDQWLHAWRSLEALVLSNRPNMGSRKRSQSLIIAPMPNSAEWHFSFQGKTYQTMTVDPIQYENEIESMLAQFQHYQKL